MQVNFNPAFGQKKPVQKQAPQKPVTIIILQSPPRDSFKRTAFAGSCCK